MWNDAVRTILETWEFSDIVESNNGTKITSLSNCYFRVTNTNNMRTFILVYLIFIYLSHPTAE